VRSGDGDLCTGIRRIALDYTATTILSKFQNDTAGRSVERVLEKLSKKKAAEILAVSLFVQSYFMNTS
jgi:hypothetical protein